MAFAASQPLAHGLHTGRRGLGKCQESGQLAEGSWEKGGSSKTEARGQPLAPSPSRIYCANSDPNQKSVFRRVLDRGGGAHICSNPPRRRGSSAVEPTIFSWQPLGRFWSWEECFSAPEWCFLGRWRPMLFLVGKQACLAMQFPQAARAATGNLSYRLAMVSTSPAR